MDVQELLSKVTDNLTVGRVFGEPIQQGDVAIVPVVRIRGGAGGGSGNGDGNGSSDGPNNGGGGGFDAKPVGVYVLKNGSVTWQPSLDVTRIAIGGQVIAVLLALVVRSILRRR